MTKLTRADALALLIEQPAALSSALTRLEQVLSQADASWQFGDNISYDDLALILAHCRATTDSVILHPVPLNTGSRSN